jgi:hypothetical protein
MTQPGYPDDCKDIEGIKCKRFDMSCAMVQARIWDLFKECPFYRKKDVKE